MAPALHILGRRILARKLHVTLARGVATSPSQAYLTATHKPTVPPSVTTERSLERAKEFLLGVYPRPDFILSHGKGSYLWDVDGKKYLDFCAGIAVNALGHADEGVIKVITEQTGKVLHSSNAYHNEWAGKLAELLVSLTQTHGGLGNASGGGNTTKKGAKVFFSNSGTEANEGAMKMARKVGKDRWAAANGKSWDDPSCTKTGIVCFENSFHGRSFGSLSVTTNAKYQKPFAPLLPGVSVGHLNDGAALEKLVNEDTCAVIVEPIQGEGGIHVASERWLKALRKRCDEVGAVLIFDEIQCGLFRTGKMWAHSGMAADCHPDIITMAKPLGNGYPIGAVLVRDEIATTMTAGTHGTTFGGSPLGCAVGYHVLTRLSSAEFGRQMEESSLYLDERLGKLGKWFGGVLLGEVRGRGLIRGLGLVKGEHAGEIVTLARERGVFVLTAGKDAVRLVPSLTVNRSEVDLAIDVLESTLSLLK